ncbi:hypothetical protein R1sor_016118 [Riccia sorocarpa]|uniref:RRM domain-containing protein n=1 Tax=Riccia sorocarpa TaxID=122646 RepID=A0ABD3HKA2_9MARC
MDSSEEESGLNSGGSSSAQEMEDEEMTEASEPNTAPEEEETGRLKSTKSRKQVQTVHKKSKARKSREIAEQEEETGDEEMSEGSEEEDVSSDGKENGSLKMKKKGQKSRMPTAHERRKKTESGIAQEEETSDEEMTEGSGQDAVTAEETDSENPDTESEDGHEAKKQLSNKKTKTKKKKGKTGVVYLSRIPPHMKPLKLRHLLSQYGEVNRLYLAPEDNAARIRRKRAGGNSGKNFTEGWVEFVHKRDAKRIAAMLNGERMDPRRRSAYHYDLWTIKYLKRFKWDNLTAEIAYKKAVRDQKIAAEVSAAKKERDFYLAKVDQARAISSMEERKQKRKKPESQEASAAEDGNEKKPRFVRSFYQRKSVVDPAMETKSRLAADVLAGVFGKSTVG